MHIADLVRESAPRPFEAVPPLPIRPAVGPGRLRKIALIGSAPSISSAPWHDPSWEIWAHATVHHHCARVDRYFDLHPWEWITGKQVPGYLKFLQKASVPVYMQTTHAEVPASIRYPRERVMTEFRRYFTSHAAWMMALALTEGVTTLGLWGIHYGHKTEYEQQRAGCEYWMGVCEGRGVQVVTPEDSPLCREPAHLYGYESHEGKLHKRVGMGGASPSTVKPDTPLQCGTADEVRAHLRTDVTVDPAVLAAALAGVPPPERVTDVAHQ